MKTAVFNVHGRQKVKMYFDVMKARLDEVKAENRATLEIRTQTLDPDHLPGHRDLVASARDLAEALRMRESGPRRQLSLRVAISPRISGSSR